MGVKHRDSSTGPHTCCQSRNLTPKPSMTPIQSPNTKPPTLQPAPPPPKKKEKERKRKNERGKNTKFQKHTTNDLKPAPQPPVHIPSAGLHPVPRVPALRGLRGLPDEGDGVGAVALPRRVGRHALRQRRVHLAWQMALADGWQRFLGCPELRRNK